MRFTRHIPNALTCGNLVCGCIATWAAFAGHFAATTAFIFAAVLFDFMDGLAARLLHATSPIGKDLDSLADIGLPVPAHAIFWASLLVSFVRMSHDTQVFNDLPTMWTLTLIVLAIAGSLLLVSELPMFSLKVKSLAWRGNERRYLLLLAAVVLTIVLPALTGISATILLYILMSAYDRFTAPT